MRDLSTTLFRGIARQVLALTPLRARLDVNWSSLGGLFHSMALLEASAPARGLPRTKNSAGSPFRPLGQKCSSPPFASSPPQRLAVRPRLSISSS